MPRLTEVQRGHAVTMLMQGESKLQVARCFGVHRSTIKRLIVRLRDTGRVADRPRSGRPRVTSQREYRFMRVAHLRNRDRTAAEIARNTRGHRPKYPGTVRSRMREASLRTRRPYAGLPFTPLRRARRMEWLVAHSPMRFPMRRWRQVLFTDDSHFTLFRPDGRRRVYRRRWERFADVCIRERDRSGGGSVMVYGGIAHCVKTPLIVVNGNLTALRY